MDLIKIGEVCFESSKVRIIYLDNVNALLVEWRGYSISKEFRKEAALITKYLTEKRTKNMISDNREAKVMGEEDRNWSENTWIPELIREGLRASAVIESKNIFGQMSTKALLKSVEHEGGVIKTNTFQNLSDAMEWIKSL